MPDIAELGLSIDTRQLDLGTQAMDRLGAASEGVEKKVDGATTAVARLGDASLSAKGRLSDSAAAVESIGGASERALRGVEPAHAAMLQLGYSGLSLRSAAAEAALGLNALSGSAASIAQQALDPAKNAMLMLGYSGAGVQSAAIQAAQGLDVLRASAESVATQSLDSAKNAMLMLGYSSSSVQAGVSSASTALEVLGGSASNAGQRASVVWEVLDKVGGSASGSSSRALVAAETFENLGRSASNVSPRAIAAADAVESLGAATERTWKKQADYNGSMNDTIRIMREAAEASKNLEDSKHRLLVELQREIDVFGMSRSELERYRAAEQGLGRAAQDKAAALGASIDAMHREERAAREAAAAEDQAAQAGDRFIKNLRDQVATLGMTTQQLQTYRAAQLGVSDAAAPLINKLAETGAGAHSAGGHMEGFSFRTAAAKRELLVLAHELSQGQFQRFGGSMMVLGEQTGAASLLFSAAGLAALGLAAAIGTMVYAMFKGASEQREMNNALIATNNYAGRTSDQLHEMARAATAAGGSIREAKKVVTELAGSGKFTGDQIAYITDAVIALEHAGSSTVKQTIKEFESLAVQMTGNGARSTEAITRAALKLDDTYHFLTIEVFAHIRALEKEGDQKAASALATAEFAKATKEGAELMVKNLGYVARGWHGVTEAIGNAIDKLGEWGARETEASKVRKIQTEIFQIDNGSYSSIHGGDRNAYDQKTLALIRLDLTRQLTVAQDALTEANKKAAAQGDEQQKKSALLHDIQRLQAADDKRKEEALGRLNVELEKNLKTEEKIRASKTTDPTLLAMISPEAIEARRLATIKEFSKKPTATKVNQVENTEMADRLARVQDDVNAEKAMIDQLAKYNEMFHKAGRLGDEEYFKNKRDYAKATAAEEIGGYTIQIAALRAHHSATEAEAAKHAKQINDLIGKRAAAEAQSDRAIQLLDAEEMLRKEAIGEASDAAINKYISGLNQEAQKIEEANRGREVSRGSIEREAVAQLDLAIAYQKQFMAGQAAAGATADEIAQAPAILKYLEDQRAARQRLAQGLDAQSDAKHMENLANQAIKDWDRAGKSIADSLSTAFGSGGKAIGQMFKAYSEGIAGQLRAQKELREAKKLSDDNPDKIDAINQAHLAGTTAQLKSYADMTTAAQGFFSEGSKGYQAMAAASQVMHAAEVALTVVKGINAVLTQGEGDPYSAFARMAAMAAIVAGLGVAIGGFGGGSDTTAKDRQAATGTGSVLGDSNAKSESIAHSLAIMEKNSGLGLAHTISMDQSLKQVVAGIGSLGSLLVRSGVTAVGAGATAGITTGSTSTLGKGGQAILSGAATYGGAVLGGSIAGAMTMGTIGSSLTMMGAVAGPIGMAIGAVIGFAVSKLFKTSTSIRDQGVTAASQTLGDIGNVDIGFTGQAYADINTKKKALGVTYSNKNSTKTADLPDDINEQFGLIILGLGKTVRDAATVLGLAGSEFDATMNAFKVELGLISLKDLKPDEQQAALETAFSKLGDEMAAAGLGVLKEFTAAGEGAFETMSRVANDYLQVSDVLAVLGKSFNVTGIGAVRLSERLITVAGGLEALTSGTGYFVENFLTEAERMAPITKSVNDAMGKLGYAGVTTVEQFKALVLAQDLNTTAGQDLYVKLIALAEPFKTVADYAAELAGGLAEATKTASEIASERKDLQSQLDELTMTALQLRAKERAALDASNRALFDQVTARQDLAAAYETESTAITSTIDRLTTFAGAIKTFRDGLVLGSLSTLSPTEKAAEAARQYSDMLAAARAGDATAQSGLTGAASAYLTASQAASGTAAQYARDYARVQADMAIMAANVGSQLTAAQAQQAALDKQVAGLITLNDSVNAGAATVAQAIAALGVLGVRQIDGSHAGGLTSVPYDGYTAELHAGERVLTAAEARAYSSAYAGGDALVAEIRGLREDNKALKAELSAFKAQSQAENVAIVQSVNKIARNTDRWDANGIPTREVE